jgi:hypothetical protein
MFDFFQFFSHAVVFDAASTEPFDVNDPVKMNPATEKANGRARHAASSSASIPRPQGKKILSFMRRFEFCFIFK